MSVLWHYWHSTCYIIFYCSLRVALLINSSRIPLCHLYTLNWIYIYYIYIYHVFMYLSSCCIYPYIYRVAQEIWHTFCMPYNFIKYWPIFKLFFSFRIGRKFVKNTITRDPHHTSNVSLHYLVKCRRLKATVESKKTSVTIHFKKLTTGNHVFIVSVIT